MIGTDHGMHVTVREQVTTQSIGGNLATIPHTMMCQRKDTFAGIWSKTVTAEVSFPVTLAIDALPLMPVSEQKDLFTGQEIRLCGMHNVGDHLSTIVFKANGNDMLTVPLPPQGILYYFTPTGHLFASAITAIELMALTGTINVELLLGTQLEGA